jgi:hypothetical protein
MHEWPYVRKMQQTSYYPSIGKIFLDGGLHYVRYGFTCLKRIELMTERD